MDLVLGEEDLGGSVVLFHCHIILCQDGTANLDMEQVTKVTVDTALLAINDPSDGIPKDILLGRV